VYNEDLQGAFCKCCQKWAKSSNKTRGMWVTKPFHNWKTAVAKMKEHSESESHRNACQDETCSVTTTLRGSIAQQVQKIHDSDWLKNRAVIKCLLHCTHFLAHQHIAHTTNFSDFVDLVVSCGGGNLKYGTHQNKVNTT